LLIAEWFYTAVLAPLGLSKVRDLPDAAIGFGKNYPEFWINKREAMGRVAYDSGVHICLRAPDVPAVNAFHAAALKAGAHRTAIQAYGCTMTKDTTRLLSAIQTATA
jgi:hypothetical protein